ncbi:MAG: cysteine peptidase family C39 domain-containing protein, partial [Myxococcota bacterium]
MTARALLVPEVVQTSEMDCGPASLEAMLGGFGIRVSSERLREACHTDVDGTSIDTLEELAGQLGLDAEQLLVPVDHVLEAASGSLPAIATTRLPTGFTHFVVIWRRHGPLVQVMDPSGGRRWTSVRALQDELYVHAMPLPVSLVTDYLRSDDFVDALRARMARLGIGAAARGRWLDEAREAPWLQMAGLDATVRMVDRLVVDRAIARGAEAERLIEAVAHDTTDALVPDGYWVARPHDDEQALVSGAVLVRVQGRSDEASSPDARTPRVAAVFADAVVRPGARLVAMLREDGWLAPGMVALAAAAGAVGVVVEALLLRGALDLVTLLRSPEQRMGAAAAFVAFAVAMLTLKIATSSLTLGIGRRLEGRFRLALAQKIPRLPDRYFRSRLASDLAHRAHAVITLRWLPGLVAQGLGGMASLVATVVGVLVLEPPYAGSVFAVAGLGLGLPLLLQPLLNERDLRVQTLDGSLSRFYLDALRGLVPLRAHDARDAMQHEHEGLLVEWERASIALRRVVVRAEVLTAATGVALTVWILSGYLASGGSLGGTLLLVY